jgi:hypothetical protein
VVKFPGSSSLLMDYAQFCEDILNDQIKASKLRSGADTFETGRPPPACHLMYANGRASESDPADLSCEPRSGRVSLSLCGVL